MNATASPLRLRRVRFKDGRTIEVLRSRANVEARAVRDSLSCATEQALGTDRNANLVGFALVAWDANGEVIATFKNGAMSTIPAGLVPQYAKDCLLGETAVRWSRD